MNDTERSRFDGLLEEIMAGLPQAIHDLLVETPVIVEDYPDPQLLLEMGMDPEEETLCGLHCGVPLTHRSVDDPPEVADEIYLFRRGIIEQAGGWQPTVVEGVPIGGIEEVEAEIRITLLHEVGHHFGLDEDDLERLGYG